MTSQFPSFYDVRNVINSSSKLKTHQLLNNIQSVNMFPILILYLYYKIIRNCRKKKKNKKNKTKINKNKKIKKNKKNKKKVASLMGSGVCIMHGEREGGYNAPHPSTHGMPLPYLKSQVTILLIL